MRTVVVGQADGERLGARAGGIAIQRVPQVAVDIHIVQAVVRSGTHRYRHVVAIERDAQGRAGVGADHERGSGGPGTLIVRDGRVVVGQDTALWYALISLGAVAPSVHGVGEVTQDRAVGAVVQGLQAASRVIGVLAHQTGAAIRRRQAACAVITVGGGLV